MQGRQHGRPQPAVRASASSGGVRPSTPERQNNARGPSRADNTLAADLLTAQAVGNRWLKRQGTKRSGVRLKRRVGSEAVPRSQCLDEPDIG